MINTSFIYWFTNNRICVKNEKILLSKDKNLLHYFYLHESKYYALDENGWKILNLQ